MKICQKEIFTKETQKNIIKSQLSKRTSLLGKKKNYAEEERINNFKKPDKMTNKNFVSSIKQKNFELPNSSLNILSVSKNLSLNSRQSSVKNRSNLKNSIESSKNAFSKLNTNQKKNSNISKIQNLKPLNKNQFKKETAKRITSPRLKSSEKKNIIFEENEKTPIKNNSHKTATKSTKKKYNYSTKSPNKEVNSSKIGSFQSKKFSNFEEEKNPLINEFDDELFKSSNKKRKFLDTNFLINEEDKYIFKSSNKKSPSKNFQSSDRKKTPKNNGSNIRSKSTSNLKNVNYFSGKKSKTKSIIGDLSNKKSLTRSDKKSIRSIKDSVKKINFDEELINDSNKSIGKSRSRVSSVGKRNIEFSRSRSKSKSKEKIKKLNLHENKKDFVKKNLNNLKPLKNKKYDEIKSKIGCDNKKLTIQKNITKEKQISKSKTNVIINKNYKLNKPNSSNPKKDKDNDKILVNVNKKIKAESSLKKLFSENPSIKNKIKTNESKDTPKNYINENEKSQEKSKINEIVEAFEENEKEKILKKSNKKITSNKKTISSADEANKHLINSMKSIRSENFKNDYLGKGKGGLDDSDNEIDLDFDNDQVFSSDPLSVLNKSNMPCFSEGYLFKKIMQENEVAHLKEKPQKPQVESEEIIQSSEINIEENSLNPSENPKLDLVTIERMAFHNSPAKIITNKLHTALKTSFKKNIPLDTELKLLSKEFRYLLSGRHAEAREAEELLKEKIILKREIEEKKNIEKKLNFEEENKINECEKIIDNSEKVMDEYENMDDEEIFNLENDILHKVLEENFGFKSFLPGQLETIKNVLNFKISLTILPPGLGKSLCYQLPSLVLDGLTIVICPLLASITDQLTNLPGCLSGASLTSFTNQKQRNEIFSAIKNKKIKILFITPERLALENFTELDEISLICFDDAIFCSPLSQNFRSSYISINSMLGKIKPNSVLLLGNNITNLVENSIVELFQLEKENVVKEKIELTNNFKISVSKDENKLTSLVKLLRSANLKGSGSLLIFCNLRKSVDKVTSFLNQNGLSASAYHAGKSEIERQLIQSNFLNDKIKILVSTSGFCNGISKSDIRFVILFDMPPSIDIFLQQLSRGGRDKKETYIHIFLNDEDYFIQRNMIYYDNIDKSCIAKFVEHLFHPCILKNQNAIHSAVNNGNASTNLLKDENAIFQVVNENSNQHEIIEEEIKPRKMSYDLPNRISFNFTKISESTGIKKNMQIFLLLRLLNDKKINSKESKELSEGKFKATCLGIGPTDINLRFFKSQPEELAENEANLKVILESSKELVGGVFKFSTGEVCQKLGITYVDLINYLYYLQNKGEIGYESRDEGMFINVESIPDNVNDIVNYLYSTNKYLVNLNIKKLNAQFCLLRKFAANSVDSFSFNKLEKSGSIRCVNIFNDYKSYEEAFKANFDLYFSSDENFCDIIISGSENELSVLIPTIILESQRDKVNLQKDIEEFSRKEIEKNINLNSIDIINVLFGITVESKSIYLSNPLWSKYQQYDYLAVLEICENILGKFKQEYLNKNTNLFNLKGKKNK